MYDQALMRRTQEVAGLVLDRLEEAERLCARRDVEQAGNKALQDIVPGVVLVFPKKRSRFYVLVLSVAEF